MPIVRTPAGTLDIDPLRLVKATARARDEFEEAKRQEFEREIVALRRQSGVPQLFSGASFANFDSVTDVAGRARDAFASLCEMHLGGKGAMPSCLILGTHGTGKTHIACAIVNCFSDAGAEARYLSLPTFYQECRMAFGGGGESAQAILSRYTHAEVLVIDEIDLHGASDNDYQLLYELVNRRYEAGRCTIGISNRGLDALTKDLNERLISRLTLGAKPVVFSWPSQRNFNKVRHGR